MSLVDVIADQPRTAELCDQFFEKLRIPDLALTSYGAAPSGRGRAVLVEIEHDNTVLFEVLKQSGVNKVLVIKATSAMRPAVVGDQVASLAVENRWRCILIDGAIRDLADLKTMDLCIVAREPRPFRIRGAGRAGQIVGQLEIGNVTINTGDMIVIDEDGIVIFDPY